VPDEAKAEGKVLPLCLQEIEHCRPYFIGLLGERYGWVPEEIPEVLFETQPWLREHLHQSVTALEILHGVLLDPEMDKHAFFYFRDPVYATAHPGFTEEDPALRERLAKLKDDIRRSGFPVKEPFATPKQLGEWVLRDLTVVIEKLYPEHSIPNALDRDAADHEAYSASRRKVYIGRQEYMDRLDAHAAGDGPPLVVVGESGGGKSALLANWSHNWSEAHAETPVLVHFIGATPDSANWMAMLRRLMGEFQRKFEIQIEIPDQPDALRMAFANALHMVAARGRLVLVLDALNQIEDRDGAPDLVWLPPVIPANVRLVVSTLPGRPLDDLKKRGWPMLAVEPLTVPEREELIDKYLKRYSKALSPGPAHRIASAPQTGNGLYLSTLLNELRQFGNYEKLNERIGWYLQAANPVELYRKIIQRWEQDYGQPDPACKNIVQESLIRLWAARRGLSETELLESLGTAGSPLPRALWSPLYLAAGDALVNRGGLLTFAHDFLRAAVQEAYLPTGADTQGAHRILAEYFQAQLQVPRQLDELPWQWQQAAAWQKLADLLAVPAFFAALWEKDQFEVKAYWTKIETHSPLRMDQVYAPVIQEPTTDPAHAWRIGTVLNDTRKLEPALCVWERLAQHFRERGDNLGLEGALGNWAFALKARGDLDGALALTEESAQIARELGTADDLIAALNNIAAILRVQGNPEGAMQLHREIEAICRESGDTRGRSVSVGNQALILRDRGDLDGAMALHKEEELLCRELGDLDGIGRSLCNQAWILKERGDLNGALALLTGQERISTDLGNNHLTSVALGLQADVYRAQGKLERAIQLYRAQESICHEHGDKDGVQCSLGNQGLILRIRGDLKGALALFRRAEQLCRELGNKEQFCNTLGDEATIYMSCGQNDEAMRLLLIIEGMFREMNNKRGLVKAIGNRAAILMARGDFDGAMALNQEIEPICRLISSPESLSICLANQALILLQRPAMKREARRLADEALAIATRHGYQQLVPQFQRIRDSIPNE
jgi:tetratricopeptide (TPR) repeat protein